jgi:hypothetical protein
MVYDFEDQKNIIYLKNQLINADTENLLKYYSEEDDYAFYLDTLNIALDSDPIFFMLDEQITRRAEDVLYTQRFKYKNSTINAITNEIISQLNSLKNTPVNTKKIKIQQYIEWQKNIRETFYSNKEEFFGSLAYDAILMEKLYCGYIGEVDLVYFFSSTNYLAKMLPEFYQQDPRRIDLTMEKLDKHAKKRWIWNYAERAFAKDAIHNIQKIKTKEE